MFRPYRIIIDNLRRSVHLCLRDLGFDVPIDRVVVDETRSRRYGDFFTNVAFRLAKESGVKDFKKMAIGLGADLVCCLEKADLPVVSKIENVGGYVNFFVDRGAFADFVLSGVLKTGFEFGMPFDRTEVSGKKVIIEHTSANPIHPLHIGHARNAFIGDALSRIFRFAGYDVSTRFYVDDCGKQVAVLALAFDLVGRKVPRNVKVDHYFGVLYSCASSIIELKKRLWRLFRLKSRVLRILRDLNLASEIKESFSRIRFYMTSDWRSLIDSVNIDALNVDNKTRKYLMKVLEKIRSTIRELDEWKKINLELASKWPKVYAELLEKISKRSVANLRSFISSYEKQESRIKALIRNVCKIALKGLIDTANELEIYYDHFDWESDLVWNGITRSIINNLEERGYIIHHKGAVFLNVKKAVEEYEEIRKILEIEQQKKEKIKDLIKNPALIRKDGTTLYLLRDIAYAYYKSKILESDLILNVIGVDQRMEQKHVLTALYLLGLKNIVDKYFHIAYELVHLPGKRMSSRRGIYITLDELLIEATKRAYIEIQKRYPDMSEYAKKALSKKVGIGALKFALLGSASAKVITFEWSRALNFEQNSGPFVQYAHARAASILRKAEWKLPENPNFKALTTDEEFELIHKISLFPEVIENVINSLRPDILCNYANDLALLFNRFYQKHPVLKAPENIKSGRLALVFIFRRVIAKALSLLGITPLYKM